MLNDHFRLKYALTLSALAAGILLAGYLFARSGGNLVETSFMMLGLFLPALLVFNIFNSRKHSEGFLPGILISFVQFFIMCTVVLGARLTVLLVKWLRVQ